MEVISNQPPCFSIQNHDLTKIWAKNAILTNILFSWLKAGLPGQMQQAI